MRPSPAKAGESSKKHDSTSEETPKKQRRRSPAKSSNSPRKHMHRQQQNNSSPSRTPSSPTSPVKQTRLKLLLRIPNSPRPEPLPTASHTPLSPPLTPEPDPPRPPDDDAEPPVVSHGYQESEPNFVPNESSIPTSAPHDTWLSAHSGLSIEEPSALALHTPVAPNSEAAVWHDSDDFGDRNYFQPEDNLWSII